MTRQHLPTAALLFVLAACATVAAPPPVPTMPAERVPRPPASTVTLIWQPGHYDWDGTEFRWIAGEWVTRAGHGTLWQDGIWQRSGATWVWQPAHWL